MTQNVTQGANRSRWGHRDRGTSSSRETWADRVGALTSRAAQGCMEFMLSGVEVRVGLVR